MQHAYFLLRLPPETPTCRLTEVFDRNSVRAGLTLGCRCFAKDHRHDSRKEIQTGRPAANRLAPSLADLAAAGGVPHRRSPYAYSLPGTRSVDGADPGRAAARAGKLCPSTVTAKIEDRLEVGQAVDPQPDEARSIILQFDLYSEQRRTGLMEDVVERMRNSDIEMRLARGDSFHVNYTSSDPRTAMRVTERLAGLFIKENLRDREMLAESSSQFLESQLAPARTRLGRDREEAGELPPAVCRSAARSGDGQPSGRHQHADAVDAGERVAQPRSRYSGCSCCGRCDDITSSPAELPLPPAPRGPGDAGGEDARPAARPPSSSNRARNNLRALELRYTAEHPNIINAKRHIAELEKKAEQEQLAAAALPQPAAAPVTGVDRTRANRGCAS